MNLFLTIGIAFIVSLYSFTGNAATRFLPDVEKQDTGIRERQYNMGVDEKLCERAVDKQGNKLYHKAKGCPQGMVFDEYCPHSKEWISECYTPQNLIDQM